MCEGNNHTWTAWSSSQPMPDNTPCNCGKQLWKTYDGLEDRLKTLEEKIDFIMESITGFDDNPDLIKIQTKPEKSLKDLWEEKNAKREKYWSQFTCTEEDIIKTRESKLRGDGKWLGDTPSIIKPKCSGYCGNDAKCKCEPTFLEIKKHSTCKHSPIYSGELCGKCKSKQEILMELKDRFVISDGVLCEVIDGELMNNTEMVDVESWLSKKLEEIL